MAYNGWKNYETWNVSMWINNDEALYNSAVNMMKRYKGRKPYRSFANALIANKTPDGVNWLSPKLDYRRLNAMMYELRGD